MANCQEKIRQFHGHLGPYVVLGYRMGRYAKSQLTKVDRIAVQIDQQPPVSCILDGLQLATGCTLGKNKIELSKSKKFKRAIFYGKNKKLIITLTPELRALLKTSAKSALRYIKRTKAKLLFIIN